MQLPPSVPVCSWALVSMLSTFPAEQLPKQSRTSRIRQYPTASTCQGRSEHQHHKCSFRRKGKVQHCHMWIQPQAGVYSLTLLGSHEAQSWPTAELPGSRKRNGICPMSFKVCLEVSLPTFLFKQDIEKMPVYKRMWRCFTRMSPGETLPKNKGMGKERLRFKHTHNTSTLLQKKCKCLFICTVITGFWIDSQIPCIKKTQTKKKNQQI